MRLWQFIEPTSATDSTPITHIVSEAEILRLYYPYWCAGMRRVGKEAQISEQACIEDWVVVHWAEEVRALPR